MKRYIDDFVEDLNYRKEKLFNIHSPSAMYHENLYRKESH